MKFFGWFLYSIVCIAALAVGAVVSFAERNELAWEVFMQEYVPFVEPVDPFKNRRDLFILILGCDENRYYARPGTGEGQVLETRARTDTIQLVRLDYVNNSVGMMQIPRDTMVDIPGYHRMKINGLYPAGGTQATLNGVASLTGITADRVVILDYEAIQALIDEVGGVKVDVERRMKYTDNRGGLHIDLQPGEQVLTGETALGYLRFRHDSDLFRGKRQQEFMIAFKEKVTSPEASVNLLLMSNLAMRVVGEGLTAREFASIGKFMQNVPLDRIKHGVLPVADGSGSELIFLQEQLHDALVESGLVDPPAQPEPVMSSR